MTPASLAAPGSGSGVPSLPQYRPKPTTAGSGTPSARSRASTDSSKARSSASRATISSVISAPTEDAGRRCGMAW
ncbi:hypothetical protein GCM10023321_73290 [Pseudonocardia eucalypti]|uniref:Uncharacterized protein n=1 Tax=Pseudonocardia eucalypti TaxID=648755 RepID=A0ABP9R7X7_9PSEU